MLNTFIYSLFLSLRLLSINNYLEYQYHLETTLDDTSEIIFNKFSEDIYLTGRNVNYKDTLSFKFFTYSSTYFDSLNIFIENPYQDPYLKNSFRIMDFAINNQYLIIINYNSLLFFEKDKNNKYLYKERLGINPNSGFQKIYLMDNKVVLVNYMFHSGIETCKKNIYIGKIDLSKRPLQLNTEYLYNEKYFKLAMFQPRNTVSYDVNNDRCFISEILDYKIRIFKNGKLQDSIVIDRIPTWNDSLNNAIKNNLDQLGKQYINQPKNILSIVRKDYYSASKMREVFYLNPDKLLVTWEGPEIKGNLNIHFDLWQELNSKWTLIKQDIRTPDQKEENMVSQNSYLRSGLYQVFVDGHLVSIEFKSCDIFDEKYKYMKTSDYWKLNEKVMEDSELGLDLYIFKLNLESGK